MHTYWYHHVDVPFGTFGILNSIFHKQISVFVFLDLDKFQNPPKKCLRSKHHRMGRKMICNQGDLENVLVLHTYWYLCLSEGKKCFVWLEALCKFLYNLCDFLKQISSLDIFWGEGRADIEKRKKCLKIAWKLHVYT